MRNQKYHCIKGTCKMRNEIYQNETKRTCAAVSTTACNHMPCTSIGTQNLTPLDSLSTVTAPSSSPSLSISPSGSSRTAPLSSSGLCPPTEVPSCPWTGSPPWTLPCSCPLGCFPPPLRTHTPDGSLPTPWWLGVSSEYLPPHLQTLHLKTRPHSWAFFPIW